MMDTGNVGRGTQPEWSWGWWYTGGGTPGEAAGIQSDGGGSWQGSDWNVGSEGAIMLIDSDTNAIGKGKKGAK